MLVIETDNISSQAILQHNDSKTCLKRPLQKKTKLGFKTDYRLMQVKSIAECSKRAFCNTSTFIKLRIVIKTFVLSFLSGSLRQVLLYISLTDIYLPYSFFLAQPLFKRNFSTFTVGHISAWYSQCAPQQRKSLKAVSVFNMQKWKKSISNAY